MAGFATARASRLKRLLPLALLLAGIVLVFATGLHRQLSFENLRANREALLGFVAAHPILAPVAYVALYASAVALSVPGAVMLTLAGGFMFGTWLAGLLVVVGATAGATVVFLIARTALGAGWREQASPWLARMQAGFAENALSYLLVLRLVPLFPFWLVNLVPAFLGVPLGTFTLATFIGIIPGSFVFASVGAGLGAIVDRGETPNLGIVFEPRILLPLLALAGLALVPAVYKRFRDSSV